MSDRMRWTLWIVGALVFLIGLVILWYQWDEKLGRDAWRDYQQAAAARGVKLTLKDDDRPFVPDEENFWASPIFQKAPGKPAMSWKFPGISDNARQMMDLEAGLELRRKNFQKGAPVASGAPETAAQFLTKALVPFDASWEKFRSAAAKPKSRLEVKWDPQRLFTWPIPPGMRDLEEHAVLRAQLALVAREPAKALESWRLLRRLAQVMRAEPTWFPSSRQMTFEVLALLVFEQGRRAGVWTEAELHAIQEDWKDVDFLAEYRRMLEDSRREMTDFMLHIRDAGVGSVDTAFWESVMSIEHSVTRLNRYVDELLAEVDVANHRFAEGRREHAPLGDYGPFHRRRYLLFEAFVFNEQRHSSYLLMASRMDQARVVCALERRRLAKGGYPEELTELVPEFLAAVPGDVFDGRPLRYKRDGERFHLAGSPDEWDNRDMVAQPPIKPGKRTWAWEAMFEE